MISHEDIQTEITKLEELKDKVPAKTGFGESNIEAIEAQIEALRENLEEDDVEDRYDAGDFTERQRDNALEAIGWRNEDEDDSPSKGWEHLVGAKVKQVPPPRRNL